MFFVASKIFWGLCEPSHVLVWCSVAAVVALLTGRIRAARIFAVITALLLLVCGVFPTYVLFEHGPDHQYDDHPVPAHVDGILTLGGGDDRLRVMGAFILARRYPGARVVYSRGSGLLGGKTNVDAARSRNVLLALGLEPSRLMLEGQSRNTWENLLFTQRLVQPKPGDVWVLAIPGYQLPRAMAIAHRLGWPLIPWPTDHDTPAAGFSVGRELPDNLWDFDNSTREWIGRQVYRWSGKAAS